MIDEIQIAKVATYGDVPETIDDLSQINFFYGSNASGKTTLSRLIANPDDPRYSACAVKWKGGTRQQVLVYNQDFVAKNFNESAELKGIFTLGQEQADTLNKISAARDERDRLAESIARHTATLHGDNGQGGKKGELAVLEERIKIKIWAQKQKHDKSLSGPFKGFMSSAEKFKSKVLQEGIANSSTVLILEDLVSKADTLFGSDPTNEQPIRVIDNSQLVGHESNPILKKRVIGKEDVDLAAMIKKLNTSDWVREGRTFYEVNDMVCPFCQQRTDEGFAKSLNEYFDEAFIADSKAIDDLVSNYSIDSARFQHHIAEVIANPPRFLNTDKLKIEKELLDARVIVNLQKLAQKKKEPSQVVDLDSVSNVVSEIGSLLDAANAQIAKHNTMVLNLSRERDKVTSEVWKYLIEVELKTDLADYDTDRTALTKAVENITSKIGSANIEKEIKDAEIRTLEKSTTSIQPTIDGINALLASFGFHGFLLDKSANGKCYKLVRQNGTDAKGTLSEGEKTFVTFLYFYHLLKGSDSDTDVATDRVVVFDDPVSSLDSDIVFVVASLIKGIFEEVRDNAGYIKQVFVFTHNVYFHKEITFNPKRHNVAMKKPTFWIVRKVDLFSKVEKHPTNPIKTTYELLWSEVRRADRSKLTIQNTLRRILENYFKILGGVDFDEICALFEGRDKLICKSLFSWVHDGSHNAHEDLYMSVDDSMVETYLQVFRAIFDKSRHAAHYEMMMGDFYLAAPAMNVTEAEAVTGTDMDRQREPAAVGAE